MLDAGQVSIFGTFKLTADIPAKTRPSRSSYAPATLATPNRPPGAKWTKPVLTVKFTTSDANPLQPREIKIKVPPARYLQYRLTLKGDGEGDTRDRSGGPRIRRAQHRRRR